MSDKLDAQGRIRLTIGSLLVDNEVLRDQAASLSEALAAATAKINELEARPTTQTAS